MMLSIIKYLTPYIITGTTTLVIVTITGYNFNLQNVFLQWLGKHNLRQIKNNAKKRQFENKDKIPTITSIVLLESNGVQHDLNPEISNLIHIGLKQLTADKTPILNFEYFNLDHLDISPESEIIVNFLPPFVKKTPGYLGELLGKNSKLSIKENSYNIK